MTDTEEQLRLRMEAAAAALDFEEARRLRDRINLLRGGADPEAATHADTSGLTRQTPGAMGLGSNRRRVTPAPGWKPPPKPDLFVKGGRERDKR